MLNYSISLQTLILLDIVLMNEQVEKLRAFVYIKCG
jgi:hypothetical protein